jgi:hypothetical protein
MVKCGIEEGTCGRSGEPESGAEACYELSRRLPRNRRGKLVAAGFIMGRLHPRLEDLRGGSKSGLEEYLDTKRE